MLLCSLLWTPCCRMVPELEPWHFRRLRISPVTVLKSMERSCPGPVDQSLTFLSSRNPTLCCRMFPECGSGHPWISRILTKTLTKGPERLYLESGNRSPTVFSLRTTRPHCWMFPEFGSGHPWKSQNFAKRTGTPLSGSWDPLQEDSEVRFRALSETPDLTSDWNSEPRTPLFEYGGPSPSYFQFSYTCIYTIPSRTIPASEANYPREFQMLQVF